jgi:hypothetical protein
VCRLKSPEKSTPDWDKNAAKKKSAMLRAQEEAEAAALKQAEAQRKALEWERKEVLAQEIKTAQV